MRPHFAVKLERVIKAPRSKVYRAFLDPETLLKWFCPERWSASLADVDERVGGRHRVEYLDGDGGAHVFESVIAELVPNERIVLRFKFAPDADETLFTATLRDHEDGTHLTLDHERIPDEPPFSAESVDAGWSGVLRRLQALYP